MITQKVFELGGFSFKELKWSNTRFSFNNIFISEFLKSWFLFYDSLVILLESSLKSFTKIRGSIGGNCFVFDTFLKIVFKWFGFRGFGLEFFSYFLYFLYISNQLLFFLIFWVLFLEFLLIISFNLSVFSVMIWTLKTALWFLSQIMQVHRNGFSILIGFLQVHRITVYIPFLCFSSAG